jgi:hypothetical protein
LDYLGFGLAPPTPSWGQLLAEASEYHIRAPWLGVSVISALIIILTMVTFIGEAIRETFDPKMYTTLNSGGVMRVGLRYFKLFYIIVILFLIAFISCSKDSDEIIANDDENINSGLFCSSCYRKSEVGFKRKRTCYSIT